MGEGGKQVGSFDGVLPRGGNSKVGLSPLLT